MKKTTDIKDKSTPSSSDYSKHPDDSFDLINKYGRCECQPTADTDNPFPKIAQGLPAPKYRVKREGESKVRHDEF